MSPRRIRRRAGRPVQTRHSSMNILVIGGGAAGMMAAIRAASHGAQVTLLEKNEKLGKKLFITGKGRCNITNSCETQDFFSHVLSNGKFLYSAVYGFDHDAICRFLQEEGLPLKEERGGRIFPVSDKSSDVIRTLERALQRRHVRICRNTRVSELLVQDTRCIGAVTAEGKLFSADAVIVATGGMSYPSTGSTGDGYRFAQTAGHTVTSLRPSLVPLVAKELYVRELEGLSLRNIAIEIGSYRDFGELVFTADGVSGPVILSASANIGKQLEASSKGLPLRIDLKPALTMEQLDARILRDFAENTNKDFRNALSGLLPAKLIPVIVRLSGIDASKKVHLVTREERKHLTELLKQFPLTILRSKGFDYAVITQGGIQVKQINPSTMESKLVKHLYFAGEVLDLDAYTGGYNLQIAWSTGFLAGQSAAETNREEKEREK